MSAKELSSLPDHHKGIAPHQCGQCCTHIDKISVTLLISCYSDTASGATIVVVAMGVYFLTLAVKALRHQ